MKLLTLLVLSSLTLSAFASSPELDPKDKNIEIFNDKMKVTEMRLNTHPAPQGPINFPEDEALALNPLLVKKITFRS